MAIEIPLTRGYIALIDDVDAERVLPMKWNTFSTKWCNYAARSYMLSPGRRTTMLLHRFIMSAPPDMQVDHADGDGLNNTRANLRLCSRSENLQNRPKYSDRSYKGVSKRKGRPTFRVDITAAGQRYTLSGFETAEAAARHYDELALKYHGEFARLNFPMDHEKRPRAATRGAFDGYQQ